MTDDGALSSAARPATDATLTVRVVKSFPHRVSKNLVLQHVDLTTTTVRGLRELCVRQIREKGAASGAWKVYRLTVVDRLDTLKLYTHAHGTKTVNLIINLDDDDTLMLNDDEKTLADCGCTHETELSLFNLAAYKEFQANPVELWE